MAKKERYAIVTPYYKEDESLIRRCIDSVRNQTVGADHFLVADGHPQQWIDNEPVRHIKLDRNHDDYGNTPRSIGALLAIAEEYDGVGLLDADNWIDSNHVEACIAAAAAESQRRPCDYVIAQRRLRRPDGAVIRAPEVTYADTNCFFFLRGSFHLIPHWGLMPRPLSPICDQVFYQMIKRFPLHHARVDQPTVNYLTVWQSHYFASGEAPPQGAKPDPDRTRITAWLGQLTARDRDVASRLTGLPLAKSIDDSLSRPKDRIVSNINAICDTLEILSETRLQVAFVSLQRDQFCALQPRSFHALDVDFVVLPDIGDVLRQDRYYDVLILCCHNSGEESLLFTLRQKNVARLYLAWMWDNHHHHLDNIRVAMLADVVMVSHWADHSYLNHLGAFLGPHLPACSRQWSARLIEHYHPDGLPSHTRANELFGGFGNYPWLDERNRFVIDLMQRQPANALSLVNTDAYFRQPIQERLKAWVAHKVHLTVPVASDLSTRVFEALMVGQIPLVPDDVPDLDRVVPPELQKSLPIVRYEAKSIDSALAAWRTAIERFDSDGSTGVMKRHAYARDFHSLPARLKRIAEFVRKPGAATLSEVSRHIVWER